MRRPCIASSIFRFVLASCVVSVNVTVCGYLRVYPVFTPVFNYIFDALVYQYERIVRFTHTVEFVYVDPIPVCCVYCRLQKDQSGTCMSSFLALYDQAAADPVTTARVNRKTRASKEIGHNISV